MANVTISGEGTANLTTTREFVAALSAAVGGDGTALDLLEKTFADWSRIATFGLGIPSFSVRYVAAPVDLRVDEFDETTNDLTIAWTDVSRAETRWRVDYSVDGGSYVVAETTDGTTQATLSELISGSTYSIRVRAESAVDASDWVYLTFVTPE